MPKTFFYIISLVQIVGIFIIYKQNRKIMGKADDLKALISGINDSTNNIAADLERIAGGLEGGLSEAEADDVIAELQTAADKLKAVADTNPEPTEPGTTEEV